MDGYQERLIGIDFDGQTSEQARLSGAVTTYTLSPEEMDRLYGKPEPPKPRKHVGWPECGQPNFRHIARKSAMDKSEADLEDVNPEEEVDLEEIERIEAGSTDPAWGFDGCKW